MILWQADFSKLFLPIGSPTKDLVLQARDQSRISLIDVPRTGGKALRLHTEPGDTQIAGSLIEQRCDVYHTYPGTAAPYGYGQGYEGWWAHSILLPDDFQAPFWHPYIIFDFHGVMDSAGANLQINHRRTPGDDTKPGIMQIEINCGDPQHPTTHYGLIGLPVKNFWYDFVHHIRWSSTGNGFIDSWVNGRRILAYKGPTLYQGDTTYLKMANYHLPWSDIPDLPSSVIHDRVMHGTQASIISV